MNGNSKRWIAAVAAIQILLYHCWIPVFPYGSPAGAAERFLISATYSGVDVFFFISAYSLVSRPVEDYRAFLVNRSVKLLPLFFIALAAGRFLWFLPAIMIVYLVLPPLVPVCRKKPGLAFLCLMLGWAGLVVLVLGVLRPAQDLGIFLFRIPAVILGAYAVELGKHVSPRRAPAAGILLLAGGLLLVYRFGYLERLNVPFRGTFYLTGIPVMLGTVLLADRLAAGRRSRIVEAIGGMTLELYFAQMVFGTFLVDRFFRLTGSRIVTNLLSLSAVVILAFLKKALLTRLMDRADALWAARSKASAAG